MIFFSFSLTVYKNRIQGTEFESSRGRLWKWPLLSLINKKNSPFPEFLFLLFFIEKNRVQNETG